jgi:ferredoxin
MADAAVLNTAGKPYGFESRRPHQDHQGLEPTVIASNRASSNPARRVPSEEKIVDAEQQRRKRGLRVTIDANRCIANGKCTTAAPNIYVLDDETGVAVLENEEDATIEQLFAGARACPTQAIIIEQFGRRVFPQILTPMFGERRQVADLPGDDSIGGEPK